MPSSSLPFRRNGSEAAFDSPFWPMAFFGRSDRQRRTPIANQRLRSRCGVQETLGPLQRVRTRGPRSGRDPSRNHTLAEERLDFLRRDAQLVQD
jgi:hypothetical protein